MFGLHDGRAVEPDQASPGARRVGSHNAETPPDAANAVRSAPAAPGPERRRRGFVLLPGVAVAGRPDPCLGPPSETGPSAAPWKPLAAFRDPTIPKLNNLRRAVQAGLRVPPTVWAPAVELEGAIPDRLPSAFGGVPCCVVRSASPTEDTAVTSNAGQLLSVAVESGHDFREAVARVVASLPRSADGRPQGVVFVQPFVAAEVAGVTFFDGFYYEESRANGSNVALTAGLDRGEVRRGHIQRGDRHHDWLRRVHRIYGGRIDLEWAQPPDGAPVLLQARPALFPIRRCETLSLANHKEILGDSPCPWIVSVIAAVGRPAMGFFEAADPPVAEWEEPYAIELGERVWVNFSAFFRLMDRWGLPRAFVTEGVGGESTGPLDERVHWGRLLRALPALTRLGIACLWQIFSGRLGRELRSLDTALDAAQTLLDLHRVNTRAFEFSVRTNFALMCAISILGKLRRALGVHQAGQVITQGMMAGYNELASRPKLEERFQGLDDWLREYGHRGPLESDPRRPRFNELREMLRADLARGPAPRPAARPQPGRLVALLARPLFLGDEYREWFRDQLMHRWQRLRARILEEARRAVADGFLDDPDDAFFLHPEELAADPAAWRACAAERRRRVLQARRVNLPATASRDLLEGLFAEAERPGSADTADTFHGIGLGHTAVVGTAVRVSEVTALLEGRPLPETPILVVDTLEPSWAVVFSRFSAVVAELGGEMSHASILLREAGIPAVVNARGAFRSIADGDRVRVDPDRGEVGFAASHALEAVKPAPVNPITEQPKGYAPAIGLT